jgi:hypothetical protein
MAFDHGASFTFITLGLIGRNMRKARLLIKDHVRCRKLQCYKKLMLYSILTPETLQSIVDLIPLEWLDWQDTDEPEAVRDVYFQFLSMRLNHSQIFIKEAQMQEKHLYEYSVIRVVPRVEREFLNVDYCFCKSEVHKDALYY